MSYRHMLTVLLLLGTMALAGAGCAGADEPRDRDEDLAGADAADVRLSAGRSARDNGARSADASAGRYTLAYPTGDRRTSVILLESNAPRQVRAGQDYSYTLRVTNLTDTPLHNVEVRDLGTSLERPATRPAGAEQPAEREERAAAREDREAAWTIGTLGPRQTLDREFTGKAGEVGTLRSCLSVTYTPTLCTSIAVVRPELAIAAAGPDEALICDTLRYRYTVRNPGTGTAENVRLEATLPEGLVTPDGKPNISMPVGDLAEGQSREVTVDLKATRVGRYAMRATARGGELEARSDELTTLVREPVLAIDVEAPEAAFVNEEVTFRVTVRNTGDAPARRAVLRLSTGGERAQERNLDVIEPNQSRTLNVTARAGRQAGDLRLSATAEATCAKAVTDTATVPIRVVPALQIESIDAQDPVRVGGNTFYTISVKNEGSGPDSNLRLRATLPEELEFVGGGGASQVTAEGRTITFAPIQSLAAGQTANWRVEVRAVRPGDARFTIEMTSESLTRPVAESEPTRIVDRAGARNAPATRPAERE
jgi:uncharacterized repeat protein (TIGR01451 family)